MKRSEAIKKLIPKVISPFEVVKKERYDDGTYYNRAERLLDFIEKELNMQPPPYTAMPNHYTRSTGEYGYECYEWEPETENNS